MSDGTGDLTFVQYLRPPLADGEVTITATQRVEIHGGVAETFTASRVLRVQGTRCRLDPDDVNSVFPPDGNQGEFANVLPHVVLAQPTLPWQRSPGPGTMRAPAGQAAPTWLAVLLFDEGDPPPAAQPVTLADLRTAGGVLFPPRTGEQGEADDDPVTVIDVPVALFNATAPSLADLDWLAHVRRADPTPKLAAGATPPAADYAVVFGNRLPAAGRVATAHLVSLEGYAAYLPAGDGTPSGALPQATTAVRLVSLRHWIFTAVDLQQTFGGMLTSIDLDPPTLRLPVAPAAGDGAEADGADAEVRNALCLGYTAMDHGLRDGGATVSWYRGPLLPLGMPAFPSQPSGAADQLLRYDPSTGMFDTTYAAAWQLGRLLALHDNAFAAALYRWKGSQARQAVAELEQDVIDDQLLGGGQAGAGRYARLTRLLADAADDHARRRHDGGHGRQRRDGRHGAGRRGNDPEGDGGHDPGRGRGPGGGRGWGSGGGRFSWRPERRRLRGRLTEPATLPAATDDDPDEQQVVAWLDRLGRLAGVPFHYLVPDARMLPPESIRFFQVDGGWLAALLDGAMSIGSPGGRATLRALPEGGPAPRSGFLLHSAVLAGWPGVEVRAYGDLAATQPLADAGSRLLAPSLLCCVFSGTLQRVDLQEPGEAVHFGVDPDGAGGWRKRLRYAEATDEHPVGSWIPGADVPVPLRTGGAAGVIRPHDLAQSMAPAVWNADPPPVASFTAAQFALELVEGVHAVSFQLEQPS